MKRTQKFVLLELAVQQGPVMQWLQIIKTCTRSETVETERNNWIWDMFWGEVVCRTSWTKQIGHYFLHKVFFPGYPIQYQIRYHSNPCLPYCYIPCITSIHSLVCLICILTYYSRIHGTMLGTEQVLNKCIKEINLFNVNSIYYY